MNRDKFLLLAESHSLPWFYHEDEFYSDAALRQGVPMGKLDARDLADAAPSLAKAAIQLLAARIGVRWARVSGTEGERLVHEAHEEDCFKALLAALPMSLQGI